MVLNTAKKLSYGDEIQVACILHDSLEDTELSYNDIKRAFGIDIAEIVYAVTDELGRNRKEKKEKTYLKIKGNWKAIAVKICDRIANINHSKIYNSRLYKMYLAEHKVFCEKLRDDTMLEIMKAWNMLDKTINT
jgi:(p)ppGpp synthase/HD superfamily hydrolase